MEYVTCMNQEQLKNWTGLSMDRIIGAILHPRQKPGDPIAVDNFAANVTFVSFLQKAIGQYGPDTVYLRDEAEYLENGTLYVVDERTPRPEGDEEWAVPSEDIFGEFEVKDGPDRRWFIQANKDHRLYSEKGFCKLKDELAEVCGSKWSTSPSRRTSSSCLSGTSFNDRGGRDWE